MMTTLFVGMWGCGVWTVSGDTLEYRRRLEVGLTFEQFSFVMKLLHGEE